MLSPLPKRACEPLPAPASQRAWVVFSGYTDLGCLKWLKRGYRHCFVVIHEHDNWIWIDPLSNFMDVSIYRGSLTLDIPGCLKSQGYQVVLAQIDKSKQKMAPVLPFTCVEVIKRFLGIHHWGIWTPYQLYKHLIQSN